MKIPCCWPLIKAYLNLISPPELCVNVANLSTASTVCQTPALSPCSKTPQGDLWVGTKSDGAFFFTEKAFQFDNLTAQNLRGEGLSHHNIWASTVVDNTLYLGTHNGLTIVDTQHNSSQILYKNYLSDQLDNAFSIYRLIPFADQLLLNTTRGLFYFRY